MDQVREEKSSSFKTIVIRASNGDHGAFQHLVGQFQNDIFRLVFFRIHSEMDAQDITQDVFMAAVKKIHQLQSPDQFKNWLYRIAVNKVNDYLRRKKFAALFSPFLSSAAEAPANPMAHENEYPGPEAGLLKNAFWKNVRALTASLSLMEKEVFLLRFFDQQEISEIAAILGKGESTVKTHLYRAIKKLKNNPEKAILLEKGCL